MQFPEGSTVAAHARDQWGGNVVDGPPRGTSTDTGVVDGGNLQFENLIENKPYVAYANVGGTDRSISFEIVSEVLTGAPGLDQYPLKNEAVVGADSFIATTSNQLFLAAEDDRLWVDVAHEDLSGKVYFGLGVNAEVGKGLPLLPGRQRRIENFTGAIYVIATGTVDLALAAL